MSRRAAWLLIATAVWTLYIWGTRIYTLARQDQTRAFKIVHFVLAAISIGLGIGVGLVGIHGLKRR